MCRLTAPGILLVGGLAVGRAFWITWGVVAFLGTKAPSLLEYMAPGLPSQPVVGGVLVAMALAVWLSSAIAVWRARPVPGHLVMIVGVALLWWLNTVFGEPWDFVDPVKTGLGLMAVGGILGYAMLKSGASVRGLVLAVLCCGGGMLMLMGADGRTEGEVVQPGSVLLARGYVALLPQVLFMWFLARALQTSIGRVFASAFNWSSSGGGLTVPDGVNVQRGTKIYGAEGINRAWWGRDDHVDNESVIHLGGIGIPPRVETRHFLITGSTGSGKSQAIWQVLSAVTARKGRAIIADSGGEYMSKIGSPDDDLILNPLDARSVKWNPFAEIREDSDCERIAMAAIPGASGSGKEWNHYARSFVAQILLAMHSNGERSVGALLDWLTIAPVSELRELLAGTPAAAVVDKGNERMLGSVRSIIASYMSPWKCLADEGDFSIRDWVTQDAGHGWLFITYRDDQMALLRHLVATWVDLAVVEALSLDENEARQLWFILDEADSLGQIANLELGLSKLRKYGGRVVVGVQTIAQLRETYGRDKAQTICANASNKLLLRAGDNETAEYFSRELGEQEVLHDRVSTSKQDGLGSNASTSRSVDRVRQAAVLPSELLALPDMRGYLSLAGTQPALVQLAYSQAERVNAPFEPIEKDVPVDAETETAA